MMTNLSGLGYVTAFGALMFWVVASQYNRSGKWLVRIFLLGLLLYFTFLLLQDYSGTEKLEDLARDLMIMGFSTWLLQFLFHKKKILGFAGFAILITALLWFYLPHFFLHSRQNVLQDSALDPNGEWLIQLKDSHSIEDLSALFTNNIISFAPAFTMAEPENTDLDDFVVANYTGQDAEEFADLKRRILDSDLVDALEENELMTLDDPVASQGSTLINNEYGLNDPLINQQWAWKNFQMQNYYQTLGKINTPTKPIILAILDTGIDIKHEDLQDVTISINGQYDTDPKGHGTHCACIAGARSNNGLGIASFQLDRPFYKLMSIRVLNSNGSGSQQATIQGILQAVDAGAQVISLSLGGFSNDAKQKAYDEVIAYANRKNVIIVTAAGNANSDAKSFSPANVEGVITVSAVDDQLQRATFSNKVNRLSRPIAAPGVSIISCLPANRYDLQNGTSMATPYVSGLVAVLKAIRPNASVDEIYKALSNNGVGTKDGNQTGPFIQPATTLSNWVK